MPAYGTYPNSKSIYPGQAAILVGLTAAEGGVSPGPGQAKNEAVTAGYKSIPVCVAQGMSGMGQTQRQITWQVKYGTAPSAIAWVLQGAIDDLEANYMQVDTSSTTGTFAQTVQSNYKFFRLYASAVTGTCTVTAKIECM